MKDNSNRFSYFQNKKTLKKVKKLIFQIIPVMIGVYLGFAMNNFGEKQKLKKQSETYKQMLKKEISENLKAIERVYPYHQEVATGIKELLTSENLEEKYKSVSSAGLNPGFVSDSAYETGIQTGIIQELDLQTIHNLNSLYNVQGKYNRFNDDIIDRGFNTKIPETEKEARNILMSTSMSMYDVLYFEDELMKSYKQILEQLN